MMKISLQPTGLKLIFAGAVSFTLTGLMANNSPTIAQTIPAIDSVLPTESSAFTPPDNLRRRRGNRTTTGTRQDSCIGDAETAFTLLSPSSSIGRSTSQNPTLSWYLPASEESYLVKLRFFLPDISGGLSKIDEVDLTYQSGIMTYSLPNNMATLTSGVDYRWQVVVLCNENRPAQSLVADAWFEILEPTQNEQQTIEQATTDAGKAIAYGQAGFWYDAIAQVAHSTEPEAVAVRHQLLRDLATLEAENEARSNNLLEIVQAGTSPM